MESVHQPKVTILGAGMYGTALATVASFENRCKVTLYTIEEDCVEDINKNHKNSKYHPTIVLPDCVNASCNLEEAMVGTDLVLCCLPVQVIPDVLEKYKHLFPPTIPFCSCSKGMIVSKRQFVSEIVKKTLNDQISFCVLSGPSFAEEIIKRFPTVVVVASEKEESAKLVQKTLSNKYFRIYTQEDVIGVEIAGALKNVFAIGCGIVEGYGYGYNTKTAIISRGTREIQTFVIHYGGKMQTLFGLAGIGDLMLTSFGECSRNRTCGEKLAKGETIENIIKTSKGVIEGLPTLEVIYDYSKEKGLDMPITGVIHDIVHGKLTKQEATERLMMRDLKDEFNFEDLHLHK